MLRACIVVIQTGKTPEQIFIPGGKGALKPLKERPTVSVTRTPPIPQDRNWTYNNSLRSR